MGPFTNGVGMHRRLGVATNYHERTVEHTVTRWTDQIPFNDAFAYKSSPEKGNHVNPTSFERRFGEMTKNDPYEFHSSEPYYSGVFAYTRQIQIGGTHYNPFDAYYEFSGDEDNTASEAQVRALNRLNSESAAFGADLAESRQSVSMLVGSVITAGKSLLALRRGNLNAALAHLGLDKSANKGTTAANSWLAYVYGWKPLANSIHELNEKVINGVLPRDVFVKASATSRWESERDLSGGSWVHKARLKGSHRTELHARVVNPGLRRAAQLGLINPLAIGWELVPFSFVIDWFVPVGNTLYALTDTAGLEFVRGWTSRKRSIVTTLSRVPGVEGITKPGAYEEESSYFRRIVHGGFPRPTLYATTQNPYSTTRALSALALVQQLTGRK